MANGFAQAGNALGQAFFGGQPDTRPQAMDAAARTAYAIRRAQLQREKQIALHNVEPALDARYGPELGHLLATGAIAGLNDAQLTQGALNDQKRSQMGKLFSESQQSNVPIHNLNAGISVVSGKQDLPYGSGGYGTTYSGETGTVNATSPLAQSFVKKNQAQAHKDAQTPKKKVHGYKLGPGGIYVVYNDGSTAPLIVNGQQAQPNDLKEAHQFFLQNPVNQVSTTAEFLKWYSHQWPRIRAQETGGHVASPSTAKASKFINGKVYKDAQGNSARYENGKWVPVGNGG